MDLSKQKEKELNTTLQFFIRLTDVVEFCVENKPANTTLLLSSGMIMARELVVCCCCRTEKAVALLTAIDSVNKKIEAWLAKPPTTTAEMTQLEVALVYRHSLQEIAYEYALRSKTQDPIFSLERLQPLLSLQTTGTYISYVSPVAEEALSKHFHSESTVDMKPMLMKHVREAATQFHLTLLESKTATAPSPSPPSGKNSGIQKESGVDDTPKINNTIYDYLPWVIQPRCVNIDTTTSEEDERKQTVFNRVLVHLMQLLFPRKCTWNIHFCKAIASVSVGLTTCLLHEQLKWYKDWLVRSCGQSPIELYETFHGLFRRVKCVHHLGLLEHRANLATGIGSPLPLISSHESEHQVIPLCLDWIQDCVRKHVMMFACDFVGLPVSNDPGTDFYRDVGLWLQTHRDVKYKVSAFLPVLCDTIRLWAPVCIYQTLESPTLIFDDDPKKVLRPGDRITRIAMYMFRILVSCECSSGMLPAAKYQEQINKHLSEFQITFHKERMQIITVAHRRELECRL